VQRRILPFVIISIIFVSFLNLGCNKLDTTSIGGDLLPAVDNVHTFADTLAITTTQQVYNPDSTVVTRTEDQAFGHTVDPLLGRTTTAGIYFQLKPTFFPYYLGNPADTLNFFPGVGLDSVVLCLKYKSFYGDSTIPLDVDVREILDVTFRDSVNKPNMVGSNPPALGNVIGGTSINVATLGDTVHYRDNKDSSINVIRIRLNDTWAQHLFTQDSFSFHTGINAFYSDSVFRRFYNGLAVVPRSGGSGNQLIYVNLADPATRIEIHFRRENAGVLDTTFNSLVLNSDYFGSTTNRSSNTADIIKRTPALNLTAGDQEIYLETNPGTYANLKIPGLTGLSNRIIHRAEIVIQQIPDLTGFQNIFKAPSYLYLDLKDSISNTKWKPIYYDLNPSVVYDPDNTNPLSASYYPFTNGIDFLYFGGYRRDKIDQFGNPISYYTFNITKYVQNIVTNHRFNYDMRLSSPFSFSYPQYLPTIISYNNPIANGRVKVGGGNNPNYKMILRIIYSNL
jgi:hypothetical protein